MATISIGSAAHTVSGRLYGVFLEDINYAVDGGLNANMVNNYSFDGVYLKHERAHIHGRNRWQVEEDPLRFWRFVGVKAESFGDYVQGARGQRIDTSAKCPVAPGHANSRYVRLTKLSHGNKSYIENMGYNGGGENADACAMSIEEGERYEFSALVRSVSGRGHLGVRVIDEDCVALVDAEVVELPAADGEWHKVRCTLDGMVTRYGRLRIDVLDDRADGDFDAGAQADAVDVPLSFDLDCVSLMPAEYWGVGDPKWRHGRLRRDLVEAIAALRPGFVRFPGGCITEGVTPGNEYRWKDTVGALPARRQKPNMWAYKTPDGSSYSQSYQIGFYEYFCLCEDLGAKPLPTLFAGISCQSPYRDPQHMAVESDAFKAVVNDYLDLIDFANGDPRNGGWAAVRAAMGHPAPFGLDMIGVGNENFGADYQSKYDAIASAIHAEYPEILCVMSAGLFPFQLPMRSAWNHARSIAEGDVPGHTGRLLAARGSATGDAIIVDEHSYHSPEWFIAQAGRFDDYPRDGAGVYFGEYSANGFFAAQPQTLSAANRWKSALAEAAFLTGCERNADVVRMTSYAPLLAHVAGRQWNHNLIEFSPSHVSPTVNYEAERLFSAHVGRLSYDIAVDGTQSEQSKTDGDGLFASVTGADEPVPSEGVETFERIVKIVNTSLQQQAVTLAMELPVAASDLPQVDLKVATLFGPADAKNTLAYEGKPARGLAQRVNESRLPVDQGQPLRFALSIKPLSITVVTVRG